MTCHVFTYGSLMFAPVWQRVVEGHYRCDPARVADHARYAIVGQTYPGMIEQDGAAVDGVLYFDVSPQDVAALDAFEGDEYRRVTVRAALAEGAVVHAEAYLYLLPHHLSQSPWQPESFQLERFLSTYCRDKL